jgi:hypothetical protein
MRTKRDIKQIWIWLPLILTVAAYTVFVTATVVLYIASRTNIIHAFAFRNFAVRLFVPMVFQVLLIVLHKIQSRGLHTTMAALNFAVIVLSIAFSWLYLSNYFGFYGGYAGLRFLSFFGGFGSVSDLFLCIFGTRKFYYGLRLLADNMTVIAHFITLYCFTLFAQQDANPALYQQSRK